ncbi:preprotein translocase subunit YajC [Pelagicoccus sp. SDUM812003]|uniref:preprotein translocase subunit YajC n=1 Tax=Pelagicoccus sp. SDUM812003 TaxID=3041267 RepID=UPI00280D7657|nr:preprotein translocase subunit YajC [Pelagicoccus sp. SDUM812003]MDQ8203063.1 preprotein translocase subunit YajC [Pelagicoccus sp. SDUM812003]
MDFVTTVLAQAAQGQAQPGWQQFLPFILIFAAMWFLIIAPQRKKQKQHQKMITELKSGAEVITSGGIYGTITNVKDDRFVLKIADNTKIEILKSAVTSVVSSSDS